MKTFYLTFGKKYPFSDNWVEVEAVNLAMARKKVIAVFEDKWAWLYEKETFNKKNFPGGKIGKTMK